MPKRTASAAPATTAAASHAGRPTRGVKALKAEASPKITTKPAAAAAKKQTPAAAGAVAASKEMEMLLGFAGKWKGVATMLIRNDAAVTEQPMAFTADVKSILGGKFIEMEFMGSYMAQSFEGKLIMGYSENKREFEHLWLDNFANEFFVMRGVGKPGKTKQKNVVEVTETRMDFARKKLKHTRMVYEFAADKVVCSSYARYDDEAPGSDAKDMVFVYERVAAVN